jgi:two-component system chemotaxis response regulator CheY
MAFNILIVDDSAPMRSVIKKTVKLSGFKLGEIHEASNGIEALEVLKTEWLDLILTDYNMPEMDGLELIEALKKDELLHSIPVVVVTTEGSQEKIAEFLEKGAVNHIQKPFTPEEIKQKLNALLGEREDGEEELDDSDEGLDF